MAAGQRILQRWPFKLLRRRRDKNSPASSAVQGPGSATNTFDSLVNSTDNLAFSERQDTGISTVGELEVLADETVTAGPAMPGPSIPASEVQGDVAVALRCSTTVGLIVVGPPHALPLSDEQDTSLGPVALRRAVNLANSYTASQVGAALTSSDTQSALKGLFGDSIPGLIDTLEVLSRAHPFLASTMPVFSMQLVLKYNAVAFLPFKLIYHQETQRRENDKKRIVMFFKIKDIMTELVDERLAERLTPLCETLQVDIRECYNVLSAQERCSISIKFLKAGSWNKVLAEYATRFVETREKISNVLQVETLASVRQTSRIMLSMLSEPSLLSANEQRIRAWFELRGDQDAVIKSNEACAELIKFESSLTAARPTSVVGWLSRETTRKGASLAQFHDDDSEKAISRAVADLRKEYRKDIRDAIQENLESHLKRFEMGLDDLKKDLKKDLGEIGEKVVRQGDRVIKYLKDGEPSSRIQDAGWRASAKPRPLIFAIRDYFVERVECNRISVMTSTAASQSDTRRSFAFTLDTPMATPTDDITSALEDDTQVPQAAAAASSSQPDVRSPFILETQSSGGSKNKATSHPDDNPGQADLSVLLPDSWMSRYLSAKRLRYVQHVVDPDYSGFTTISEINKFTAACPKDWSTPLWIAYWALGWQIFATKYCIEIDGIFAQMSVLRHEIGRRMPGNKTYVNEYIDGTWQHVTALTSSGQRYEPPVPWLADKFASYVEKQETTLKERLEKVRYLINATETVNLILDGDRIEYSIFALLTLLMRKHLEKMRICLKQEVDPKELRDDLSTVTFVVDAAWQRFVDIKDRIEHGEVGDAKQIFSSLACGLFKNYLEWDSWLNPRYFMASDLGKSKSENLLNHTTEEAITPTESSSSEQGFITGQSITQSQDPCAPMSHLSIRYGESGELSGTGNLFNVSTWTLSGAIESTKIEYSATFFFDEAALVGDFCSRGIGREKIDGSFYFRRKADDEGVYFSTSNNMCFRPTQIKVPAKERWSLIRSAVMARVERRSRAFLHLRLSQIQRTLQLTYQQQLNTLSSQEKLELAQIYRSFSFEAYAELYKLYQWYHRSADLQSYSTFQGRHDCDGCRTGISRSRVVCLDCVGSDAVPDTVDFCSKSSCIDSASLPGRGDVSHHPSHAMIKTRDFFLLKDYYVVKARADYATHNAMKVYKEVYRDPPKASATPAAPLPVARAVTTSTFAMPAPGPLLFPMLMARQPSGQSIDDLDSAKDSMSDTRKRVVSAPAGQMPVDACAVEGDVTLECHNCKRPLSAPCWFCADCPTESCDKNKFICDSCERHIDEMNPWDFTKRYQKEATKPPGSHDVFHVLVRIAAPTKLQTVTAVKSNPNGTETGTIQEVTKRMDHLSMTMEAIQDSVGRLEARVENIEGFFRR
ncbi:hypothetical protein GGX14DRAFT_596765 [Mycena pura]|uniref:Uncharacterized protein n=1 Tax=Mycena pura TaxID=153505 RepID=A0AAD6USE8_9AGAR|nr:hypothetical protein GGX14DRAFT_596765 [Mycena pura]